MTSSATTSRPALTPIDRCDRCGAQAYVRATMTSGGEILLCGHHATKHMDALTVTAISIDDYRDTTH